MEPSPIYSRGTQIKNRTRISYPTSNRAQFTSARFITGLVYFTPGPVSQKPNLVHASRRQIRARLVIGSECCNCCDFLRGVAGHCTNCTNCRGKDQNTCHLFLFFFSFFFLHSSLHRCRKRKLLCISFPFFSFCTNLSPLVRFQIKCAPHAQSLYTVSKSNVSNINVCFIPKDFSSPHYNFPPCQKNSIIRSVTMKKTKKGFPVVAICLSDLKWSSMLIFSQKYMKL